MTWTITEDQGKLYLAKEGKTLFTTQLWDRHLARQNPIMLSPAMFENAMSQAARKLGALGDGPSEQEIKLLVKELRKQIIK